MENDQVRKRLVRSDSNDAASDSSATQADVPKPKDDTPEFMKPALEKLPPRWKNWWIRFVLSVMMILSFCVVIYIGHVAFVVVIFMIQFKCFHEIITIGHQVYKSYDLPWFRSLSWYFLLIANYFFYGETLNEYFGRFTRTEPLMFFFQYHRMISYMLYLLGLILFVLSLKKKMYRLQFFMFGWTHVTLLIIVTQAHLIIQNLYEGIIWLIVPVSMVIVNDIMAYIFGFFFGKTQLIKLSPKKTWEGFIGGGISTVVFGWFLAGYLCQYKTLVCPIEVDANFTTNLNCEISNVFLPKEYNIPLFVQVLLKLIGQNQKTVMFIPFQLHSLSMSLFASLIAPFGGFFASGFKRAFKVKDFGDIIPGHGGLMDRFDCQYLVATFVHVYFSTFIKVPSPKKLLPLILALSPGDQEWIMQQLQQHLLGR